MGQKISLAAIRMDAAPAPTQSRLEQAESLIAQAAAQGAQIAVLPEVFNTGYEYHDRNYDLAEPIDGPSVRWMKAAARQHNLHLAGTVLLRDGSEIFNAMFLVAPDGRSWRYDKSYPWIWERAYFRPRRHPIAPAETDFGKIGMMICWDVGHPRLWAAYAGKVDLMLVSSCPPLGHISPFILPDGKSVLPRELGPLMKLVYRNSENVFGEYMRQQAAWLGVPLVQTTGAGQFRSFLPRPGLSLGILFMARPDLWKYIRNARDVYIECGYFDETFIADQHGRVLSRASLNGDNLIVSTVELDENLPNPSKEQPKIDLSLMTYAADALTNALLVGYYEKNKPPRE
ncbi:MAG: hypothetical protein CVU44_12340 [Chloroflexi bacterium HGW-Chloroflexi-6]|nr:MAG: hypothetical protein CVU44_12340 [Chloroflexi bacterium HGW-Chloroflexi-6]